MQCSHALVGQTQDAQRFAHVEGSRRAVAIALAEPPYVHHQFALPKPGLHKHSEVKQRQRQGQRRGKAETERQRQRQRQRYACVVLTSCRMSARQRAFFTMSSWKAANETTTDINNNNSNARRSHTQGEQRTYWLLRNRRALTCLWSCCRSLAKPRVADAA